MKNPPDSPSRSRVRARPALPALARPAAGLTALTVLAAFAAAPPAGAAAAQPAGPAATAAAGSAAPGPASPGPVGPGPLTAERGDQVTLITGDQVRIEDPASGHPGILFTPGPGRAGLPYHVSTSPGPGGQRDITVLPADAAGLVTTGHLDPRLFDVSLLARDGYRSACTAAQQWPIAGAARARSATAAIAMPAGWPRCAAHLPAASPTGTGQTTAGQTTASQTTASPATGRRAGHPAPLYRVRVRVLNRAGVALPPAGPAFTPPYSMLGTVVNTVTGAVPATVGYDRSAGAYTMRLPAGHYYLDGLVDTAGYRATMVQPDVTVHGSTTITLDARTAVPVSTRTGHSGARTLLEQAEFDQVIAGTGVSSAFGVINSPGDIEPFYLTPTAAVTGRPFLYSLHASLTTPGAFPTARHYTPASYEYNLIFTHRGSVPSALSYRVTSGRLATVPTRYFSQRATLPRVDTAQQASLPLGPGDDLSLSFDSPVVITPGGQATLYYTTAPHVHWFTNYFINDVSADPGDVAPLAVYQPGHVYQRSFGAPALGPAGVAAREGNILYIYPAPFSASEPGHYSQALSQLSEDGSAVRSTLSLNGTVIGATSSSGGDGFPVPRARGRYTLTEVATRPPSTFSVLGTRSTAVWSFFSADHPGAVMPPLLTVRAAGPFSLTGVAPAGRALPLTLTIDQIPNGAKVTSLGLAASFNGGHTWHPVRLRRSGAGWLALVTSPRGNGYVSLRTTASDSAGDTAALTTIRAYAVSAGTGGAR